MLPGVSNVRAVNRLAARARACQECAPSLPHEPRPVFQVHADARVLIVGQAPGARVHESGVAWDDKSGERLRSWLGVDEATFYDPKTLALLPMGFCFPGRGRSGDLPPRPECAPLWMDRFIEKLEHIELTILIGRYAQDRFLGDRTKKTLTETVRAWREFSREKIWVLPHPSPRNNIWLRKNPFFIEELVPKLQRAVGRAIRSA